MRVNYRYTVACGNITREHIPEEGALPGTRTAKDSQMATASVRHNAYSPAMMVGIFTTADEHGVKLHD